MRISVYAIAKNERKFVERFMNSAMEADEIVVLDTGSTDGTPRLLGNMGADVYEAVIKPWRFDVARNTSLAFVDPNADLCICMDLDEVLTDGWRERIEEAWEKQKFTRARYRFDWGSGVYFDSDKIHTRFGYVWHHPCHEILKPDRIEEVFHWIPGEEPLIRHLPDAGKSRGQYLDLLKVAVEEAPHSERTAFYYARELYFAGKHEEALGALATFLSMPTATWDAERAYAMRVMAKCYGALGQSDLQMGWIDKAIHMKSNERCGWVDKAEFHYERSEWKACLHAAERAIQIKERSPDYTVDPRSWGHLPYDLAALSAYYMGEHSFAMSYGAQAVALADPGSPDLKRLLHNQAFYRKKIEEPCANEATEGNLSTELTAQPNST